MRAKKKDRGLRVKIGITRDDEKRRLRPSHGDLGLDPFGMREQPARFGRGYQRRLIRASGFHGLDDLYAMA